MSAQERYVRWKINYAYISVHTAQMWADHFITELNETCLTAIKRNTLQPAGMPVRDTAATFAAAQKRLVVIGYNAALSMAEGAVAGGRRETGYRGLAHVQQNTARCAFDTWL